MGVAQSLILVRLRFRSLNMTNKIKSTILNSIIYIEYV
jgi:hypothetical protein